MRGCLCNFIIASRMLDSTTSIANKYIDGLYSLFAVLPDRHNFPSRIKRTFRVFTFLRSNLRQILQRWQRVIAKALEV